MLKYLPYFLIFVTTDRGILAGLGGCIIGGSTEVAWLEINDRTIISTHGYPVSYSGTKDCSINNITIASLTLLRL